MIRIRPGKDRGQTKIGWLDARHTFSFGRYYDEDHMGFRNLRVINQDRVSGGGGFPMHGHSDMEIITYVLEGELAHKDSLGHESVLKPGGVQVITAGTGVTHSEFNPSAAGTLHLLQMWVEPDASGLPPAYAEKTFHVDRERGRWHLIASRDGRAGSLLIHQDVSLSAAKMDPGQSVDYSLDPDRHVWIHLASGEATLNGRNLSAGDGVAVSQESVLRIEAESTVDLVLFDLG
ncbi:pirin family protein [bacterium]|nr:pirin family protein [bacterium]